MQSLDPLKLEQALPRLQTAENIWFATVRGNGSPHLVPLWYVWLDGQAWVCTPRNSQKHINILGNSHTAISLEDAVSPVILEGTAEEGDDPTSRQKLNPHFIKKYEWDFIHDTDADYILIVFTPSRILSW